MKLTNLELMFLFTGGYTPVAVALIVSLPPIELLDWFIMIAPLLIGLVLVALHLNREADERNRKAKRRG
jgi:hypothetical protein